MNHGNYFTDHNKELVVSNAKQLTATKPKEPEPHPLQREFIDVLKSLGVYEDFQKSVFVLPGLKYTREYCNICSPQNWLDSNARGYSEWLSYLKQYHPISSALRPAKQEKFTPGMAQSVCPKHHEALEKGKELSSQLERIPKKPTPETAQQEKFKQFLRDKGVFEKFEQCMFDDYSKSNNNYNIGDAWAYRFSKKPKLWLSCCFLWDNMNNANQWVSMHQEWRAYLGIRQGAWHNPTKKTSLCD